MVISIFLQFNAFGQEVPQQQKVVITKIGATWCPNCGTTAWDNFTKINNELDEKAVILSIHPNSSSRLHSVESADFANNLPQAFGQPLFYVNKNRYRTESIISNAESAVVEAENRNPMANTGIKATIQDGALVVDSKVKFFTAGNGDYYLSLLIIEDGVIEEQSNRGDEADHKKILRASLTGGTFGQSIANGTIAADTEYTFNDTKSIAEEWDAENLEITAIIWEKINDSYEFVNANSVEVALSTAVNFLDKSGVTLSIAPTLIQETATINLKSPINLAQTSIAVFNAAGQQVNTLFEGTLNNGAHQFSIHKSDLKGSGIYYLQMAAKGSVISRKLVVE